MSFKAGSLFSHFLFEIDIQLVAQMMTAWSEKFAADLPLFRAAMVWLASAHEDDQSPILQGHRAKSVRAIQLLVGAIERGQEDGSIRTDQLPAQLAMQIWSAMIGAMLIHSASAEVQSRVSNVDFDSLVPNSLAILCDGLRPGGTDA